MTFSDQALDQLIKVMLFVFVGLVCFSLGVKVGLMTADLNCKADSLTGITNGK